MADAPLILGRLAVLTREISNYHHARFLALAGHGIDLNVLAMSDEGPFAAFLKVQSQNGYRAQTLYSDLASYRAAAFSEQMERDVSRALCRIDPAVVAVAGWASPESVHALDWARARGRRVVVMSDSQAHDARRSVWREAIKSRFLRCCDAALVAGRSHRAYLQELGFDSSRVALGYDAVDNAHFAKGADAARLDPVGVRQRLGLPPEYIIACGRFIAKKNFSALVAAYARARARSNSKMHLVIVGEGEERQKIEMAIRSHRLDAMVHLPGFCGYDELPAYLGLAKGFVHPALTEQWGLVVSEAAASGLPLVLSRTIGAAPELLVEGANGWLCDPRDEADMSRALEQLMTISAESWPHMANRSRRIVADWGLDRYVQGMVAATSTAKKGNPRRLGFVNRIVLRGISRRPVEDVR